MVTVPPLNARLLRVHASHLDGLRARFGPVRAASRRIARDQAAFGPLCGWIFTGLGDRHARQDELIAYVEENLFLAAQGLRRVASGQADLADLANDAGANDAGASDAGASYAGVDPAGDPGGAAGRAGSDMVARVIDAVASREWVEHLLASAAPVAEFAAPATDSFTALRTGALDWAMAYIPSLRQMLDDLTGMPDLVASHATTWQTIAAELRGIGADLRAHLYRDLSGWPEPKVRGYLAMMSHNVDALAGLAEVSTAIALITKAAGDLILLTRDIVRGLIADLVAHVIIWLADNPTVVTPPVTVARLATMVTTCWRIHAYVTALVTSLVNLSEYADG